MTTTGTDIATYEGGQLDAYRPQIMTPEAAKALDRQLRQCTAAVLQQGTDYGIIPGTGGEQVLFRPGAQKLLQWFGLSCTCERTDLERDDEGRKHGITYRATVTRRLPDGTETVLATCEGTADYDEDKFYQPAETVQAKAEAKERKFAEIDRRPANPNKWKHLGEYRAPWNTLMKRAQKRAIVGAVIDATAAGGIFKVETDDYSETADGGPSWYQQALGEASAVTTKEDANRLWAETAQAKLSGLLTADQATHVQNRIRQRVNRLAPIQVDVEDLAKNAATAAENPSPAHAAAPTPTPSAAPASPVPQGAGEALPPLPGEEEETSGPAGDRSESATAAAAGPDDTDYDTPGTVTDGQLTAIWTALTTDFGFSRDEKDQARGVCARIARRELASSTHLSFNEAKDVRKALATVKAEGAEDGSHPRAALMAFLHQMEAADGQAPGA